MDRTGKWIGQENGYDRKMDMTGKWIGQENE